MTRGFPPVAISNSASAASLGKWSANPSTVYSSALRTSANHSTGTPYLNQLGGARPRMRLQLAALGPVVGFVVMIHIAKQQAALCLVDDQADIAADAHRPEVLVPRLLKFVQAHPWA